MARARRSQRTVSRPCILIVDDELDEAVAKRQLLGSAAETLPRTPDDVTLADLRRADLVLVDFVLDQWMVDPSVPASVHPKDGVALAAVFRSHSSSELPTAYALHSGRLDGLSGGLPRGSHLHVIARANNVEWVFSKKAGDDAVPLRQQVLSLAKALQDLPSGWPTNQPKRMRTILEDLLKLSRGAAWRERAWQQIEVCHPPIHELSPPTHAVALIRWLLHSIMPYATFLWDFRHLAARLRVTPRSLIVALKKNDSFAKTLALYKYRGSLHDFLGDRWWRPGIEHLLWKRTEAKPFNVDALQTVVGELSQRLEPVSLNEPVVAFDQNLRATDQLIELSDAVELQPDDWPPFAERPFALRELAMKDPRLKSLIAPASG